MGGPELQLNITPISTRFDPADERWSRHADDLRNELLAQVPGTRAVRAAVPGAKGTVDSIVIALGSAGVFSTMAGCFKFWLDRDQTRRIGVTWTENGVEKSIVVSGEGMSASAMEQLAEALARRIEA